MNDSPLVDIPFQSTCSAGSMHKGLNPTNTPKDLETQMARPRKTVFRTPVSKTPVRKKTRRT